VVTIGMHVGGGPFDEATKQPMRRSVEPRFAELAQCWTHVTNPARTDVGVDLLIESAGRTSARRFGPGKDAGTLSITGTKLPPITPQRHITRPGYTRYSYIDELVSDAFDAGDAIAFGASGGEIGAFSAAVVAPSPLVGLHPDPLTSTVALSATSPSVFNWTAGDGDEVTIGLFGGTPFEQVHCSAADTGTFAVPAAVGALFPAGAPLQVAITRARRTRVPVDPGVVEIRAEIMVQGRAQRF
jgi:hypothetical protein